MKLHRRIALTLLFAISCLFMSCVSIREYTKESTQFYKDDEVLVERTSLKRDGKVKEEIVRNYSNFQMDELSVKSVKISTNKSKTDSLQVWLYKTVDGGSQFYATNAFKIKDGVVVKDSTSSGEGSTAKAAVPPPNSGKNRRARQSPAQSKTPSAEEIEEERKAELLLQALDIIMAEANGYSIENEESDGSVRSITSVEKVKVESRPNGSYIFYSIAGKPFVIAGTTALNLLKCAGYALYNFAGGYSTATEGKAYWKMPDTKKARAKAKEARENNGIKYYPEYHLPFTNNHIEVTKIDSETLNPFSTVEGVREDRIISETTQTYDNTISVERSAADANSTAATVGLIGTVVTVPVSVVTWIGGAAFGIMGQVSK